MRIYQRRTGGNFYYDIHVNGKRVQMSTRTRNENQAKKVLALRMSEAERGVFARLVRVPLADLNKRYMEHAKTHKRSWTRDEQMLGHIERIMGPVLLTQITPLRVEEYQQKRLQEKVCPATVNRELGVLKHELNLAERWGLHQGPNPVRLVKFLREDNLQLATLSEDEERLLLKHCPSYLQDMVLFALNTGLRCGDLFDLKWEEVDLEGRRMSRLMQKSKQLLRVPLNDVACDILESWEAQKKCPYVFFNQLTGDRFRDLKAGLKKAVKDAGLEGITWHRFRHTFASRLVRNGVDIVTVKELCGHSHISTTMRYAHTNEETKRRAVAKVGTCDKSVTVIPRRRRRRISQV
jgi:integrase